MNSNTKSSITLPPEELRMVKDLQSKLALKTKVEVVRRGLRLLKDTVDRNELRRAFREASKSTRRTLSVELEELDFLAAENLEDE
jgi:Arc/MetJ-type ribon-helix-helix transcriptional regulator